MYDFRKFRRGPVTGWIGTLPNPCPALRYWGPGLTLLSEEGVGKEDPSRGRAHRKRMLGVRRRTSVDKTSTSI